jgi:COMPASS component SPP1
MVVGELGYGRIESLTAGPSTAPRRPGSGHGQGRKSMPVSELLLDKPIPIPQPDVRDRLVSPLGRRSPPGSQIGRAKAARKSDEHIHKEIVLPPPPLPPSLSIEVDVKKQKEETKMPEIRPKEEVKLKEEPKSREAMKPRDIKDDTKPTRHRVLQEDTQHKKLVMPTPVPAPPAPLSAKIQPLSKKSQDDAHEWFLQQYEEDPSPTTSSRPEPPHSPSPSLSPATSTLPVYGPRSPPSSHKVITPITLEQELEELVSEPPPLPLTSSTPVNKKQDPDDTDMDLDVDLAVTELVAETLNGENVKQEHEHLGMEVDVEDELLSLIDDRPVANNSINVTRRPSTSSSSHVTVASGTGTSAKQPPPLRSVGDAPHNSPTISASSTLVSPAARHPSTRPTSERGSMPPPPTTNAGGVSKKSNERAGGVVPAKKKKEPAPKVCFIPFILRWVLTEYFFFPGNEG